MIGVCHPGDFSHHSPELDLRFCRCMDCGSSSSHLARCSALGRGEVENSLG